MEPALHIAGQQNVFERMCIPAFQANNGFYIFCMAFLYKGPYIGGHVNVGKGQTGNAHVACSGYQVFGGNGAITQAEIGFTVQVHGSAFWIGHYIPPVVICFFTGRCYISAFH